MAVTSLPTTCIVTVNGSEASIEVAGQSFTFNAAGTTANMAYVELGLSFKGIDTVTFSSTYDVPVDDATLLGDLVYTTYNAQDKTKKGDMS